MKIVPNKFYLLIAFLFGTLCAIAQQTPPRPRRRPPPPPGLAIDENIFILVLIALFMGIYIIYSFELKQKTPM